MRVRMMAGAVAAASLMLLAGCSSGGASTGTLDNAPAYQQIDAKELHRMLGNGDVYLVNVHVPFEGNIPGTDASIPYTEIASRLDELPFNEQPVVIYCRSGNMSAEAAAAMVAAGAPPFFELRGGFYAWESAGYPLEMTAS